MMANLAADVRVGSFAEVGRDRHEPKSAELSTRSVLNSTTDR